jgi:hypothetical protein
MTMPAVVLTAQRAIAREERPWPTVTAFSGMNLWGISPTLAPTWRVGASVNASQSTPTEMSAMSANSADPVGPTSVVRQHWKRRWAYKPTAPSHR